MMLGGQAWQYCLSQQTRIDTCCCRDTLFKSASLHILKLAACNYIFSKKYSKSATILVLIKVLTRTFQDHNYQSNLNS